MCNSALKQMRNLVFFGSPPVSHRAGGFEAELRQVAERIMKIRRQRGFLVAGVQGRFTDGGRCLEMKRQTYESWGRGKKKGKKEKSCLPQVGNDSDGMRAITISVHLLLCTLLHCIYFQ